MCSPRLFAFILLIFLLSGNVEIAAHAAESREVLAKLAKERKLLEHAVRHGRFDKAVSVIDVIGKMDSSAGIEYLLSLAHVQPRPLYDAIVQAMPGSRSDAMQALLIEKYREASGRRPDNWVRRVMLLDVLSNLPGDEQCEAFTLAVRDDNSKVRLAGIRLLHRLGAGDELKIPVWIESLTASEVARDVGTPHVEARTHLHERTSRDFPDAASWSGYWAANAKSYEGPGEHSKGGIEYRETVEYYGSAVTSRRVLFLVDTSGSMNIFDHEDWPNTPLGPTGSGLGGSGGTDGGGTPVTNPAWKQWIAMNPLSVRIDRAKAELIRLVEQLPPDTQFNVIAFDTQPVAWQRSLVPVHPATIAAAKQFVGGLRPRDATAADLALATAFEANNVADTIYFLSDGEPSRDGINVLPALPLLAQVEGANRFHRIVIHTLGFGHHGEAFMKALAEQNGGQHLRIVGPPAWAER